MQNFEVIFNGQRSRAICFNSGRDEMFVNFDHMKIGKSGFESPRYSRSLGSSRFGQLIVQTAANDWYLNADLGSLCEALLNFCRRRRNAISIAFSMGGYAALLFSRQLNLSRVLLVSPQFSPYPNLEPFDRRYSHFFESYGSRRSPHCLRRNAQLEGHVAFDPEHWSRDREHARLICLNFPKILPVELKGGGHPCTKKITALGNFRLLQRKFLLNIVTDPLLRTLHSQPAQLKRRATFEKLDMRQCQPNYSGALESELG